METKLNNLKKINKVSQTLMYLFAIIGLVPMCILGTVRAFAPNELVELIENNIYLVYAIPISMVGVCSAGVCQLLTTFLIETKENQ